MDLLTAIAVTGAIYVQCVVIGIAITGLCVHWRGCREADGLPLVFVFAASVPSAAAFATYQLTGGIGALAPLLATLPVIPALWLARNACQRLWRAHVKAILWLLGILLFWVAQQALIPAYSGAFWYGDWLEHYEFSLFFADGQATTFRSVTGYGVAARTWLASLFGAFQYAQWGREFWVFQLCLPFLGLSAVAAAGTMASVLFRRSLFWPVLFLLPLLPTVSQNATYTWPKLFMTGCLLTYLLIRIQDQEEVRAPARRGLATGWCGASAVLAHSSAALYIVGIELAMLIAMRNTLGRLLRSWTVIGIAAGLLLGSWYGWLSFAVGWEATLDQSPLDLNELQVMLDRLGKNAVYSIVPEPALAAARSLNVGTAWRVSAFLRFAYDSFFGLVGILGWLLFAGSFVRRPGGLRGLRSGHALALVGFALVGGSLGLSLHAGVDTKGLVSVALLPVAVLLVCFVVAQLEGERDDYRSVTYVIIAVYGLAVRGVHLFALNTGLILDNNAKILAESGATSLYARLVPWERWIILSALVAIGCALLVGCLRRPGRT